MADFSLTSSKALLMSGTANQPLAQEIAERLDQPLCQVTIRRFADGEIFVKIDENVRGQDVFIIQPTCPPAENLVELLILIDAAERSVDIPVLQFPLWLAYAAGPGERLDDDDLL